MLNTTASNAGMSRPSCARLVCGDNLLRRRLLQILGLHSAHVEPTVCGKHCAKNSQCLRRSESTSTLRVPRGRLPDDFNQSRVCSRISVNDVIIVDRLTFPLRIGRRIPERGVIERDIVHLHAFLSFPFSEYTMSPQNHLSTRVRPSLRSGVADKPKMWRGQSLNKL